MLTFVNSFMLLGGLLVAVPIVLHLIMRQQPKYLEFPALRFIQQKKEANRRRLLLRHLILLALRCLAILLLALALARPKIASSRFLPGGDAPLAAALLFDTSPRMDYKHHNVTRLEASQQFAFEMLPQLPRESRLVVLDSTARRGDFDVDLGAARLRVERLQITPQARPLGEMIDNALELVEQSELDRKELFLFTDLSQPQWTSQAIQEWNRRANERPHVAFHLIDVGVEQPVNYALADLELSGEVVSRNSTLDIETAIERHGPGGPRTVKLFLLDADGRPQLRDSARAELGEAAAELLDFRLAGLEIGTHHGFVAIEGQDGLAADDRRYFSVDVAAPWRVLLASPEPVDRYGEIVQYALAPPELRQKGISRFECELVTLDRLADMPLDVYDAIWLLDPTPLKAGTWQRLGGYAAGGGGVVIALGGNAGRLGRIDPTFSHTAAAEMLPGEVVRQWRTAGGDVYLAPRSLEHPVLSPFKLLDGDVPWYNFPILKYWEIDAPAEGVNVIVPFSNGAPAVMERALGQGRVITLATPITDLPSDRRAWNYLLTGPDAWPGFILVNELARYVVGSADARYNYVLGEQAEVALPKGRRYDFFWLTTPPPAEDRIKTTPTIPENRLVVTSTQTPGIYHLEAGGEEGVQRGFSVNLPAEATDLTRIDPPAIEMLTEPDNVDLVREPGDIEQMLSGIGGGAAPVELYPWLLLLLVLVITSEQLVSSLFYRRV